VRKGDSPTDGMKNAVQGGRLIRAQEGPTFPTPRWNLREESPPPRVPQLMTGGRESHSLTHLLAHTAHTQTHHARTAAPIRVAPNARTDNDFRSIEGVLSNPQFPDDRLELRGFRTTTVLERKWVVNPIKLRAERHDEVPLVR
jgi:hypothetical protein